MEQPIESDCIYLIGPNIFHAVVPDKQETLIRSTLRFTYQSDTRNDPWFPVAEGEQLQMLLSVVRFLKLSDGSDCSVLFRLVFQKKLGMTPNEYRNSTSDESERNKL